MEKQNNTSDQDTPPADSTPKVTGIGGIFLFYRQSAGNERMV